MEPLINVAEPMRALIKALGLRPKDVLEMRTTPHEIHVVLLRRQRPGGAAYMDRETGDVATERRTIGVTMWPKA